ncbi:MAG: serine/threonine protein kinase [Gemmatimonadota bacterium]|nr:serine/threonine protein kinase [Gemmatimonadota bacterium]
MPDLREQATPPLYVDPMAALRLALRGHYEIERQIGQGAFATVYIAQDLKHERKVAIKVLNADPTSETSELRFIREIRVLARLQHPNILPLHDSGHVEALLYYVMPYVGGETLRERIDRERQVSVTDAACIAKEAADALACAHAQGIVHRDIKPENILLSGGHAIVADFGIARAIDVAGIRSLTRTGVGSPGTPAYMSPEQLLGDREVDTRSDIYSVGCVLYEMLTGKPPFAGKDGFVKRFTEPPPLAGRARKAVPGWLDVIIERALARNPADRYQSAQELVHALTLGLSVEQSNSGGVAVHAAPNLERTSSQDVPDQPLTPESGLPAVHPSENLALQRSYAERRRLRVLAWGIAALAVTSALAYAGISKQWRPALLGGAALDSTRIAILPFAGLEQPANHDSIAGRIYTAFSQWDGLNLVPYEDVRAALGENARNPGSRREAIEISKKLGAGRFVWGWVGGPEPGGAQVEMYDVGKNEIIRELSIRPGSDQTVYVVAARNLLSPSNRPASADGGDGRTRSYAAWSAYGLGHISLREWNLAAAESAFRAAVAADPTYSPARVWLAQVLDWRAPQSSRDWREQAARALMDSSKLAAREHSMALGLGQLGDRRYPEACASYAVLTRTDSLDFVGWYGLAQCHSLDSVVIPSATSPSGWAFRSRYADAADAYIRALRLEPEAHAIIAFDDLKSLLPIASTQTRQGQTSGGVRFAGFPALIHDTAVFVPYELSRFANLPARQTVSARNDAIQHNLDLLLDFTTDWTERSPRSASAFQALADVLEVRGEIRETNASGRSALTAARRARALAVNSHERLNAMTREAWLRFKQGDFSGARILTDTLIAANPKPDVDDGRQLLGLAALTGKVARTAELAALTNAYTAPGLEVPSQVRDVAAAFFARAALGVCDAATFSLEQKLDDEIAANVAENGEMALRQAIKARPMTMLAPCTDAQSSLRVRPAKGRLLRMQQAYAKRDMRSLASLLDSATRDAKTQKPGDVSLDFTYQIAWLRAATGDTAGAVRQLDLALRALPSLSPMSIREVASSAAAGRAMALRAEIAAARGEQQERQKWSRAVANLWMTSDAEMQPTVRRMRAMAAESYVK